MGQTASTAPRTFSLNDGGPFRALMARLGLIRKSGMIRGEALAVFAWLPIVIGEGARAALGLAPDPTVFDLSIHVRLLVALPTILFAERLVEKACRSAITSLYASGFCERALLDPIVDGGERLRDARWPEAALGLLAIVGGQLALWHVTGPTGVFHGGTGVGAWTFPRAWYAGVSLPLAQFVMFRWLWRWAIWSWMLVRIAALPLEPLATHPDGAAGLGGMARPVSGYAGFAFAIGAVLAGAWGTQILAGRTTVNALLPALLVFLFSVLAIAVAPLLSFCGHLFRARRRALANYGDFANGYMRAFHRKWIESGVGGEAALGTPDLQSLNDLDGAFDVINHTRLFVFGMRPVIAVWAAAILPMLPLFASKVTVESLITRIASTVLGGIPL